MDTRNGWQLSGKTLLLLGLWAAALAAIGASGVAGDPAKNAQQNPPPKTSPAGDPAGKAAPAVRPAKKGKTSARKGRGKKPATPEEEEAERKKKEAQRREFFKKTGVWLWPELTDRQQEEALAQAKDYVRKISEKYAALGMRLYETDYFLFLSDFPPSIASIYTSCLDNMHERLCGAFSIKDKDRLWLGGKVPVIAFARDEYFARFEQDFFRRSVVPRQVQGLCHATSSGVVVISCHSGKDPYYLASVIVHETTHGFVHRYKSAQIVPNWLNEGIAEWVAMNVVVQDRGVKNKVKAAIGRMRQTGSMGGDFFTTEHLAAEQYGMATAMVEFLLHANPKGFRELIDRIKSGEKWEDALMKSYRVTPEQLAQQFGMAVVRVRYLRP